MRFGKSRSTSGETKVEIQMTPMLDMIFQLLVFFILTFKPVIDEGQFEITMSSITRGNIASPSNAPALNEAVSQVPIQIVLRMSADGHLASSGIVMGDRVIPDMAQLQAELRGLTRESAEDFNVVVEADSGLQYQYVMQAVNAISHAGISNINFATTAGSN